MAIRPELRDEIRTLSTEERLALAAEIYEGLVDEQRDPAWDRA